MGDHLSVGLLALSAIADDPRVRRQGDAFAAAGWRVIGIGVGGASSHAPAWPVDDSAAPLDWTEPAREAGLSETGPSTFGRVWRRRERQVRYVLRMQGARLSGAGVERAYWALNPRFRELYANAARHRPSIWLANDWNVLPIAARLAEEQGAILVYDTHELASEEYSERPVWRVIHRPLVMGVERRGLERAALVTCVSEGISGRLQEVYRLKERPMVVCNTPSYQEMPFRPTGEAIEVLYHGVVAPGRGLEECIESVTLLRPEFRLTIRGPGSDSYHAQLKQKIASHGLEGRVRLAAAVPMTELVRSANTADIGLFALPDHSRHNRFVLPNKFFEYTMAGLALCVSNLPEMAHLLGRHDLGLLVPDLSPAAIATQLNSLDRNRIDCYKRNALAAARQLNWEKESEKLLARCTSLVAGRS